MVYVLNQEWCHEDLIRATVLIIILDWLVIIVRDILWYLPFPLLFSPLPDLLNGFVALPNYMLPESTGMLWEMLQSYKEVRHHMT